MGFANLAVRNSPVEFREAQKPSKADARSGRNGKGGMGERERSSEWAEGLERHRAVHARRRRRM